MKYLFCFVSILILSLGVQCKNMVTTSTNALSLEFIYNSKEEGYEVILTIDKEKLEVNEVISYGIVYLEKDKSSTKELKIKEDNYLEQNATEETIYYFNVYNIDPLKYNIYTNYRAYIKYIKNDSEYVLYSNEIKKTSLYELIKDDDSSFSEYVRLIVNNKILKTFNITIDTKNYKVATEEENYNVEIKTDYNLITVTIILEEGYFLDRVIYLYANNILIEYSKLSISDNKIIYIFSDPNWTKPY